MSRRPKRAEAEAEVRAETRTANSIKVGHCDEFDCELSKRCSELVENCIAVECQCESRKKTSESRELMRRLLARAAASPFLALSRSAGPKFEFSDGWRALLVCPTARVSDCPSVRVPDCPSARIPECPSVRAANDRIQPNTDAIWGLKPVERSLVHESQVAT